MSANAAAVGMFDGVHRGHLDIMRTVAAEAAAAGGRPIILTFAKHPLSLLRPTDAPGLLTTAAEKEALIKAALPDAEVHCLDFGQLRGVSARDFLAYLRDHLGVAKMVMGYDNRFGCDGPRDRAAYDALGRELGVRVVHVAPLLEGEATVSSSLLRSVLRGGRVEEAARLLGRPYEVSGTVVHGKQVGRTIGVPTANLQPDEGKLLPAPGVYAARARVEGPGEWPAMVNIGHRPTVEGRDDAPLSVEAHLIGADADMYGRRMTLQFVRRLRDERRFGSLQELREQLERDAREVLTC